MVAGRVGDDPARSAPELPVEFDIDGFEEVGVGRMIGPELLALTHPTAGVVQFGAESVEAGRQLTDLGP